MLNKLSRLLDEAGISLTDHQKNQLVAYVGLLDKWNKAYNLTSVRDPNEMLVRHILDSIIVAPYLQGSRFIDVGTGPGFTGDPVGHRMSGVTFHPAGQPWQARALPASGAARAEAG